MQVADVSKPLGAVGKMTDASNTIIFSKGRSVITSDLDGKVAKAAFAACKEADTTELNKKNGVYTFDMWVPTSGSIKAPIEGSNNSIYQGARPEQTSNYHNIGAVSGFAWLDDELI